MHSHPHTLVLTLSHRHPGRVRHCHRQPLPGSRPLPLRPGRLSPPPLSSPLRAGAVVWRRAVAAGPASRLLRRAATRGAPVRRLRAARRAGVPHPGPGQDPRGPEPSAAQALRRDAGARCRRVEGPTVPRPRTLMLLPRCRARRGTAAPTPLSRTRRGTSTSPATRASSWTPPTASLRARWCVRSPADAVCPSPLCDPSPTLPSTARCARTASGARSPSTPSPASPSRSPPAGTSPSTSSCAATATWLTSASTARARRRPRASPSACPSRRGSTTSRCVQPRPRPCACPVASSGHPRTCAPSTGGCGAHGRRGGGRPAAGREDAQGPAWPPVSALHPLEPAATDAASPPDTALWTSCARWKRAPSYTPSRARGTATFST